MVDWFLREACTELEIFFNGVKGGAVVLTSSSAIHKCDDCGDVRCREKNNLPHDKRSRLYDPSIRKQRFVRIPIMVFPQEASPEQTECIQSYLSHLEHDWYGLESLDLDQVRAIENPQLGYLLVKAWLSVCTERGFHIPPYWYEVINKPNEYLNPTKYIPAEDAFNALCDI